MPTPVVYVARGSHASYFEAGFHQTEAWYDLADGQRKSPRCWRWRSSPRRRDGRSGAAAGATRGRGCPAASHQPSPTGPGAKAQWDDPAALLDEALSVPRRRRPAPDATVRRLDGRLRLDFDFARPDRARARSS